MPCSLSPARHPANMTPQWHARFLAIESVSSYVITETLALLQTSVHQDYFVFISYCKSIMSTWLRTLMSADAGLCCV